MNAVDALLEISALSEKSSKYLCGTSWIISGWNNVWILAPNAEKETEVLFWQIGKFKIFLHPEIHDGILSLKEHSNQVSVCTYVLES